MGKGHVFAYPYSSEGGDAKGLIKLNLKIILLKYFREERLLFNYLKKYYIS